MAESSREKDVSAKEAVECIRSDMSNAEVMKRFQINTKGYVDLLRQLLLAKLVTEEDLARRGIRVRILSPAQQQSTTRPIQTQQVVNVAPPTPADDGDQFLDTAALTDLLSFGESEKRKGAARPPDSSNEVQEDGKDQPDSDTTPSKSRFSLSGLFRKSK
jgi:hypothetical protein